MTDKIEFHVTDSNLHNTWVMRITADRRIEVNEDVEVTEAAQKVLDAMQYLLTPQRKPLLASDIVTMYDENPRSDSEMIAFARAIEAAHNIKEQS